MTVQELIEKLQEQVRLYPQTENSMVEVSVEGEASNAYELSECYSANQTLTIIGD